MASPAISVMTSTTRSRRSTGSTSCRARPAAACSRSGSPPRGWPATTSRSTTASCDRRSVITMTAMTEDTGIHESYYILATSSRRDERTRVIKQGDSFGVFDHAGMIGQAGMGELGLYHDDTRYLSTFEVALERRRPLLLNSTVLRDNILNVDLANPDLPDRPEPLARDSVHLFIQSFLWDRGWHARLQLHNFALRAVDIELSLLFDADFADVFEVRGPQRPRRGKLRPPAVGRGEVALTYDGLDRVVRTTR